MNRRARIYKPVYDLLVWNRTDLASPAGYAAANASLVGAKNIIGSDYKGEIIPPFAAMRLFDNPIVDRDHNEIWLVRRPDDDSQGSQIPGLHCFNGPSPIPMGAFGLAAQHLPAPVLCDMSLISTPSSPYVKPDPTGQSFVGLSLLLASSSWALHPVGDFNNLGFATGILSGGNLFAALHSFVVRGQYPLNPSGKMPGKTDSPQIAFNYSNQIFWINCGRPLVTDFITIN